MGNTVKRPGGDAAVVRVGRRSGKALALATDCTPRYCRADPVRGGMQAVAESWRNLTAVGALPLALTDNMNFGNPERPEIMGQFAGAIEGMREACLGARLPGRLGQCVALQRDERQRDPADPGDRRRRADRRRAQRGRSRAQAGRQRADPDRRHQRAISAPRCICARSRAARTARRRRSISPPSAATAISSARLIARGRVAACHDLSDGGLLVAHRRDGDGRRARRRRSIRCRPASAGACLAVRRGPGALPRSRPRDARGGARARRWRPACRPGVIGTVGGAALTLPGGGAISVAQLKAAQRGLAAGLYGARA